MSNNDQQGNRYSRRLADEAPLLDPFEGNDFSNSLSPSNGSNDAVNTTTTNTVNDQSSNQRAQCQPHTPHSVARHDDLSSDDSPYITSPSIEQDEDLSFGSDLVYDFLDNQPVSSRLGSNTNADSPSTTSSRMTSHSDRISSLEQTINGLVQHLAAQSSNTQSIEDAVAAAVAKALTNQLNKNSANNASNTTSTNQHPSNNTSNHQNIQANPSNPSSVPTP